MDNIKFSDFQNICRTCMFTSDLIFIHDNNLIDVLQFLSGTKYSKTDGLPQKLCVKCIRTMNEIQSFKFKCQQSHSSLTKCRINYQNKQNVLLNNKTINTDSIAKNANEIEIVTIKEEVINNTYNLDVIEQVPKKLFKQMATKEVEEIKNDQQTYLPLTNCLIDFQSKQVEQHNKTEVIDILHDESDTNNLELETEYLVKEELLFNEMVAKEGIKIDKITNPGTSELNGKHSFESISKLNIQTNFVQNNSDEQTFKSDSNNFESNQMLLLQSGEQLFQCNICNEIFKTKNYLTQHKEVHISEHRFECDVCMKCFKYPYNLIEHQRKHSGERPYECDICKKGFTRKQHLMRHKIGHSDERPYECDICSKSFKCRQHLEVHKRLHNDERPYRCHICSHTFRTKGNLVHHKKVHSNERQFECDICTKSFKRSSHLIQHKIIHSDDRPYQCDICYKGFYRKQDMERHKARHNEERSNKYDVF